MNASQIRTILEGYGFIESEQWRIESHGRTRGFKFLNGNFFIFRLLDGSMILQAFTKNGNRRDASLFSPMLEINEIEFSIVKDEPGVIPFIKIQGSGK